MSLSSPLPSAKNCSMNDFKALFSSSPLSPPSSASSDLSSVYVCPSAPPPVSPSPFSLPVAYFDDHLLYPVSNSQSQQRTVYDTSAALVSPTIRATYAQEQRLQETQVWDNTNHTLGSYFYQSPFNFSRVNQTRVSTSSDQMDVDDIPGLDYGHTDSYQRDTPMDIDTLGLHFSCRTTNNTYEPGNQVNRSDHQDSGQMHQPLTLFLQPFWP